MDAHDNIPSQTEVAGIIAQKRLTGSTMPRFLPNIWSHPILGYLAAILLQLLVILGILALTQVYPAFRFPEGPLILVILLTALQWGAGPSVVATVVGAALLIYFILPPIFSPLVAQQEDIIGVIVYLIVGFTVSILASQTQRTRHRAEAVSRRLETIIEAIPDSLVIYDHEGKGVQFNRSARKATSTEAQTLPLDKMPQKLHLRSLDGEPLSLAVLPLTRALQGETVAAMEMVYQTLNGQKERIVLVSAAPLIAPLGNTVEGAVTVTRDVTERKQKDEQEHFLAEVSKALSSTLDYQETLSTIARLVVPQLADWFAVDLVDANGNFELVEIDHVDPTKVQWAKELREKYPVDPHTSTGLPNVVRTGQSELYADISQEMLVATAKNAEELAIVQQVGYTSVMLVPLVARGQPIGVVTFVSAESGRKYNERDVAFAEEIGRRAGIALDNARLYREVQQARDQLEIILQGVADGIIVYDRNSQVIYANEAAAQMNGFTSVQAMMGTSSLDIVAQYEIIDEHGNPFNRSQLTHKRIFAGEKEVEAIIGSRNKVLRHPEHWSLVKSRPVFDEQGETVFAITIIHDITEQVLTERRKDEFISMASHELKTPVTSLKGFTHVLQRRLARQGDEQALQYLSRMDAQLTRLTKLINDLLDISKMESGKLSLQEETFDLDELVQETLENVQAATTTHQLLIEGKTEATIWGDKDRIAQVYINLLTNAIKYSPGADKVIVRLCQKEEQAIVSIQDFGLGIAETYHQKIFERLYQVTDPEEKTYPGLGIGLYISNDIVERHHGRLWLESSKGQGSTFYVALPLLKEA